MRVCNILKDPRKLQPDYVPERLIHRESAVRTLLSKFDLCFENPSISTSGVVMGPSGAGKTALVKIVGRKIEQKSAQTGAKVKFVYASCCQERSYHQILLKLMKKVRPNFPERGHSPEELLRHLASVLSEEDMHIILCLDDADFYVNENKGPAIFYQLSRFGEYTGESRLSLITVIRDYKKFQKFLDSATRSSLQRWAIVMERYSFEELRDILWDRAQQALVEGTYDEQIIDFIAQRSSKEPIAGNARCAIVALGEAARMAESEGCDRIYASHVRTALSELNQPYYDYYPELQSTSEHERFLLLAIARYFKDNPDSVYATTGAIKEAYHVVCESYGVKPVGHTKMWQYLNNLAMLGLIEKQRGRYGRGMTSYIALIEVFDPEKLEEAVLKLLEGSGWR